MLLEEKTERVTKLHREDANVTEQLKLQKAAAPYEQAAPVKSSGEYRNLPQSFQMTPIDSIMEAQITLVPVATRVRHRKCANSSNALDRRRRITISTSSSRLRPNSVCPILP